MKVIIFGGTGNIGKLILKELVERGHLVTVVTHDNVEAISDQHVQTVGGNILDPKSVAQVVAGYDAVISAFGPRKGLSRQVVDAAQTLISGLKAARVSRLIIVGGAGSLKVASGEQLVDSPDFPLAVKEIAGAHREALEIYKSSDLDWTFVSPPILIRPGQRTSEFRVGGDQLLTDASGKSEISIEDFAIALVNELEHSRFSRKQFTVAY